MKNPGRRTSPARPVLSPSAARPGIVLYGPTSSGKTALSLDVAMAVLARGFVPVILNADSRQVYKGMDVGTSKIKPQERRGIDHRLLDIADPVKTLSLERYVTFARKELDNLPADPKSVPIFVGGTATYVQAVVRGWSVAGSETARRDLAREFPRGEINEAYRLLQRIDPARAAGVHRNNYEAILNALARAISGSGVTPAGPAFSFTVFVLDRGPAETDRRIARTLDRQLEEGLLEEVSGLDERFGLVAQHRKFGPDAPSAVLHTHGYREFVVCASESGRPVSRLRRAEVGRATAAVLEHITAYSRRQRAAFRKMDHVRVDPDSGVNTVIRRVFGREPRTPTT